MEWKGSLNTDTNNKHKNGNNDINEDGNLKVKAMQQCQNESSMVWFNNNNNLIITQN